MNVRGWVYIITNEAMPRLLKIGYSTKDPKLRAQDLNNTGAPHPYHIVYDALGVGPRKIEQKVHSALRAYCVGKEWFKCSVDEAVETIRRISDSSRITESPWESENKPALRINDEYFGPTIHVRCPYCGEDSVHPDSHLVYCPRCKRSMFTHSNERF